MINLIVATDINGGIGKDNKLLWHIPKDLKRFKSLTTGKTVVMGRKTFESLPFKNGLPNRNNIVLTRGEYQDNGNVKYINDINKILEMKDDIFIIGGAEIYKQFLPYCDKLYLTKVFAEFEADTFFHFNKDDFNIVNYNYKYTENGYIFQFITYIK